jgi:hypothetical protein
MANEAGIQEKTIGHMSFAISHLSFEDSVVSGDL